MKTLLTTALLVSTAMTVFAQDYQGANAILKQLAEKANAKPVEKQADPVEELRLKIKSLRKDAVTLAPTDAAQRWLALLDAYFTIPSAQLYSQRAYEDRLSLSNILTSLPPPASWDEIGKLLATRKTSSPLQDEALRLFAAVLRGDEQARKNALAGLRTSLTAQKDIEDYERESYQESIDQLAETIDVLAGSDADKLAAFERRVALLESGDQKARDRYGDFIEVPDLVRFSNEKAATDLLARVLKLDCESLSIVGTATNQLAAALALKNIATLKKPHWDLVQNLDHAPLFEALRERFPQDDDWRRSEAAQVYFLALVAAGRGPDAQKFLQEANDEARDGDTVTIHVDDLDELGHAGLGAEVRSFFRRLLMDDPTQPYWEDFIQLSARQDASPDALELLRESLARDNLSADAGAEMQSHLYLALLAADERDEGLLMLRNLVKAGPRTGATDGEARAQEMRKRWEQVGVHVTPEMLKQFELRAGNQPDGGQIEHVRLADSLATLGRLLGKPEIIEEALSAATTTVENMPEGDPNRESTLQILVNLLLDHQRGPQAEKLLVTHLSFLVAPDEDQGERRRMDDTLALLVKVYVLAGRHADALTILEQSPYWGAPDLAAFEATNAGDTPLLLIAARALSENNRIEDGRRVIRRAAQDYPANDDVYELLLKLESDQPLEAILDQLARRDRFEERALIWKARVQLDAGKIPEAENTIRSAIAIDPSDGEQGKGDRMRAYAVLADILEEKGDAATAGMMRGAVRAIRESEEADDWWNAGLLSEAVRRYEASLLEFADAYCIQSRLALRYSELGQHDKAEEHYLRAFELMPDSFGRVESHCFGCEGAFDGQRAQNAAEKVFARLAGIPPVKAQVHYLVGYLRESQNRPMEAADSYRQAVKTDPDYLNAWARLASLADTTRMPREESETAALEVFRLDPASRHSSPDLRSLRDLRRLWTTLLEAEKSLPTTETGPLLPLPASKARIESQQTAGGDSSAWESWSYPSLFSRRNETREHLVQNPIVQTLGHFIDQLSRR